MASKRLHDIFGRLQGLLGSAIADPAQRYGATYSGTYEPTSNRVMGVVEDRSSDKRYPPASVSVLLDGELVGSSSEFQRAGDRWHFAVNLGDPLTANDIVRDGIRVFAIDVRGGRSELKIEGSIQLSYIREALAPPSETELVVDFAVGGNSKEYVGAGWSNPEPRHTWTDGKQAEIKLSFRCLGSRYRLEMLAWPYVNASAVTQQAMLVHIGDALIHSFVVDFGQKLLECDIPEKFTNTVSAVLRLDLLDAVRPSDVEGTRDRRLIAFAFRRLTLKRYLQGPPT